MYSHVKRAIGVQYFINLNYFIMLIKLFAKLTWRISLNRKRERIAIKLNHCQLLSNDINYVNLLTHINLRRRLE